MKKIVVEFIPIVAITFFTLYTKATMEFSHTILGKLLAIFVIIVYSLMDKWYGLLACGIVIFYYQLFVVEVKRTGPQASLSGSGRFLDLTSRIFSENPLSNEGMTTYTTNDIQHETTTTENNDIFVKEFQQEHCEQGSLKYKDMDVKSEMAEHVFPEIDYKNDYKKCNPCDNACYYSIVAKKMISEDNIIKSKNSKDDVSWFHQIFGQGSLNPTTNFIGDHRSPEKFGQSTNPMGAIGVVSEPFSIYS